MQVSPIVTSESFFHQLSPAPVVETLYNDRGEPFWVLREDKLEGGTKQRAARHYLYEMSVTGVESFCYASPFAGFAQVALAYCCQKLNLECHIFAEKDPTQTRFVPHAFTQLAKDYGATIHLYSNLVEAELAAERFGLKYPEIQKIPLGFNCPHYTKHFCTEILSIWNQIKENYQIYPERVWLPVGSGTLTRAVRNTLPHSIQIECLDVRVLEFSDERIKSLSNLPNTGCRQVPELFCETAEVPAPIASNSHYDSKLWRFLRSEARPGDLWWNVAK